MFSKGAGAVAESLTRRERVRASTVSEIKETARRILVTEGSESLSLRAIARDMGMTAPALYRYFPSREDLVLDLVADLYHEVSDRMEAARDAEAPDDAPARLLAVSRAFRAWALAHPREFALTFGSPIPGVAFHEDTPEHQATRSHQAAVRFGGIFGELVARIYLERRFPVPAEEDMDPALRDQLHAWSETFPVPLPAGVAQVFLSCWIRLYGTVTMEVFDHLKFALGDAEPLFEAELRDLAAKLDIAGTYRPPDRSGR
jgi:AcrR family transcriptional regulator